MREITPFLLPADSGSFDATFGFLVQRGGGLSYRVLTGLSEIIFSIC